MRRSANVVSVVLLACVVTLGTVTLFGDNIRKLFGASAGALAGNAYVPDSRKAMRNFGENSAYDGQPVAASRSEPLSSGNTHARHAPNPTTDTRQDRLSTFAVDVDTASYALFRRTVNAGGLPHPDSVRVEEWVNYFGYRLPQP